MLDELTNRALLVSSTTTIDRDNADSNSYRSQ